MSYKIEFVDGDAYLFDEEDVADITTDENETIAEDVSVEENGKLDNSNVIRNISFDQTEILHNIMQLYTDGKPFDCDMTASELKFYRKVKGCKYVIPEPKYLFDVFPKEEKIKKIEPYGRLPLDDESIDSIVIDLPFVVSPPNAPSAVSNKEGASLIFKRFFGYYPVDDLYSSYYHWISEAYRVVKPNGTVVFKTQSTISGAIMHNVEEWSFMCAQRVGFTVEDKFILEAKARIIAGPSKMKKQQHARKYTSVFYVFKKFMKKKSKNFNYFELIEKCREMENNRYNTGDDNNGVSTEK